MNADDAERVFVADVDELHPGDRKIVDAGDTSVGVFNVDGTFYALRNQCAHQGGPVCTGKLQGKIVAEFTEPGERVRDQFDDDTPVIACPWHGYEYEVETGTHVGTDSCSIPTYEVIVEGEKVYVEV